MEHIIPYYEDLTRISNSNIGLFLKSGPAELKKMLSGTLEKTDTKYYAEGTRIHASILEPETFWDNYTILDFEIPKSINQKNFADEIATSTEIDIDLMLIEAYKKNYSYSGKSDEKILEEAKALKEKVNPYIEYLKNNYNTQKIVMSWAQKSQTDTILQNIKDHKKANELLYDFPKTTEAHNEFHINWTFPKKFHNMYCECKSLLDRVMFDHTLKKITLIDIKTTFDIENFLDSVENFDYKRQLSYYWMAIHWYFKNVLKKDISEYSYETYIIAISTVTSEVRVFKFLPEQIEAKIDIIESAIDSICFHLSNDLWEHRKEYYDGDGSELAT